MFIYRLILIAALFVVAGCTNNIKKTTYVDKIEECKVGQSCTLVGDLTIYVGSRSSVGVMDYEGTCLSIALPNKIIKNYKIWDGQFVSIKADVYAKNTEGNVLSYKLNDRWVTAGVCANGIVLYVTEIKKANSQ